MRGSSFVAVLAVSFALFACGSNSSAGNPAAGDAATDAGIAEADDAAAIDAPSPPPLHRATVVIGMVGDPRNPSQPLVLTGIQVTPSAIYVTGRQAGGATPDSYLLAFPPDGGDAGAGTGTVLADCQKPGPQFCMGQVSIAGVAIQGSSLYTTIALTNGGAGDVYQVAGDGGSLTLAFASTYMNYGPQHCQGVGCGLAANAAQVCWTNSGGVFCLPASPTGKETQLFVPPTGASVRAIAMDDASFFTNEIQGTTGALVGGSLASGGPSIVAQGESSQSMAVDDTDLYWSSFDGCSIYRVPKQGGGAVALLFYQCVGVTAIALDATSVWFTTTSGAVERISK